jgi:hypothetical protein
VRWSSPGAGTHFIGPGRRWGGGEAASGGGVLIPIGFKGVKGEEETGRRHFSGAVKVEEGGSQRRMAWQR